LGWRIHRVVFRGTKFDAEFERWLDWGSPDREEWEQINTRRLRWPRQSTAKAR
jgi:hypothetical protein